MISWTYLDNFFFMVSNGGPKEKCWKKQHIILAIFQHFFFGSHEKKSCLNKFKFWEASRNHKKSLSWKFQYSILKNAETSHILASISENPVPLSTTQEATEKKLKKKQNIFFAIFIGCPQHLFFLICDFVYW